MFTVGAPTAISMEETKLMQSLERLNDRLKQSKNNRCKEVAKDYMIRP
jgi:hypothetical protein